MTHKRTRGPGMPAGLIYYTILEVDRDDDGFVWAWVSCPSKHMLALAAARPGNSIRCYKCEAAVVTTTVTGATTASG